MILSQTVFQVILLDASSLVEAILERRNAIRYFRDQRGDDRCFLDYYLIWGFLADSPPMPRFSAEEGIRRCRAFYEDCRSDISDAPRPKQGVAPADAMLASLPQVALAKELIRLQAVIARHRDTEFVLRRPRNVEDDRILIHDALPERTPCDFRLPSRRDFLENAEGRHGCAAFWASHAGCGRSCDLHRWGPCGR